MKIHSLLLAGLIVGQVMPGIAMEKPKFDGQRVIRTIATACGNALHGANKLRNAAVGPAIDFIMAHPRLIGGIYLGGMATFWTAAKLDLHFDIGYKISCFLGKYSLDEQLIRAVRANNLKEAQRLLTKGANPNTDSQISHVFAETPLRIAIQYKYANMLDLLLKNGADVNAGSNVYFALSEGIFDKVIARKLIEAGADIKAMVGASNDTVEVCAKALAARTGNQDYINVFKLDQTKL